MQNLVPLDRWSPRPVNGQLTVTIGKFYRVTGESTQHRGVEPDVTLPSQIDMKEVGESALEGRPALGSHRRRALPQRGQGAAAQHPGARHRREGARRQGSGLPLAGRRPRRRRHGPQADLAVAEPAAAQGGARAAGQGRLARENARRAAQNLPALKTAEELADAKFPDTVLDQAAEVMTDMVTGLRPLHPRPARTVRSEPKKPQE